VDAETPPSEAPAHESDETTPHKRDALDTTFNVALIFKGADGVLELVGGVLLLIIAPDAIDRFARWLTQHELSQDPHDFFARHLLHMTGNLRHTQVFGALYLLTHGLAKIIVVVGLWRRARWAYPVAFVFLGGFAIYQIYRMTYAPTIGLALLTVFDLFILWLTWREYLRSRHAQRGGRTASAASPAGSAP